MDRRSYGQYCALARALDVAGERWTLLVVRDLLLGPKRFTDLLGGLPGIGRNLLTARLRHLEAEGVVRRRTLPPPAASRVYELTDDGRQLGLALGPLTAWGARRLGRRRPDEFFRPSSVVLAMAAFADRGAARGVHETYQFEVDDEAFHLRVDDGRIVPREGSAEHPDLVVRMDSDTFAGLISGGLSSGEALARGRVVMDGPAEAAGNCIAIFPAGPASGERVWAPGRGPDS